MSLLGCGADLTIPEEGADTNMDYFFTQMENTIKELKDENKLLR